MRVLFRAAPDCVCAATINFFLGARIRSAPQHDAVLLSSMQYQLPKRRIGLQVRYVRRTVASDQRDLYLRGLPSGDQLGEYYNFPGEAPLQRADVCASCQKSCGYESVGWGQFSGIQIVRFREPREVFTP